MYVPHTRPTACRAVLHSMRARTHTTHTSLRSEFGCHACQSDNNNSTSMTWALFPTTWWILNSRAIDTWRPRARTHHADKALRRLSNARVATCTNKSRRWAFSCAHTSSSSERSARSVCGSVRRCAHTSPCCSLGILRYICYRARQNANFRTLPRDSLFSLYVRQTTECV